MGKTPETPEEQLTRLESDNAKLKSDFTAVNSENSKLKSELSTANSKIKTLEDANNSWREAKAESDAKIALLESQNDDQEKKYNLLVEYSKKEISELSAQLASVSKDAESGLPTVIHNKVKYQVIGKVFKIGNDEVTVDQLRANSKLVGQLIDKKVGFLVPVE